MDSLELHKKYHGKLQLETKIPLRNKADLSIFYTPGVAEPSRAIFLDRSRVYDYTIKGNSIAVVTDGSAVLGLGNIGPEAALPVMEGKCALFKKFANIDAWPICLNVHSADAIVSVVKALAPGFGGINLEDIAAPQCFEIERRLREELDIPVVHDDQHATAVVVLAGLINALKIVQKELHSLRVVISGAGAAGLAIADLLLEAGVKNMLLVDRGGILSKDRRDLNEAKKTMALRTNPDNISGTISHALHRSDVLIGVSSGGIVNREMVASMNERSIVFALANPTPEIFPFDARTAGAAIIATGRSDFPNQLNNALVFPGLFRGALDKRILQFTNTMFLATAKALARLVLSPIPEKIIPEIFDQRLVPTIAKSF